MNRSLFMFCCESRDREKPFVETLAPRSRDYQQTVGIGASLSCRNQMSDPGVLVSD